MIGTYGHTVCAYLNLELCGRCLGKKFTNIANGANGVCACVCVCVCVCCVLCALSCETKEFGLESMGNVNIFRCICPGHHSWDAQRLFQVIQRNLI